MYFIRIFAAMKKERIQIDLTSGIINALQIKANKANRTRKSYIELLCIEDAYEFEVQPNIHKCPAALWRKFSPKEKVVYNSFMNDCADQLLMTVLKKGKPVHQFTKEEWKILTHNAACRAIWALPKHK